MEQEVKILNKILNSEVFLNKFPLISHVFVNQYGEKNIDVVFSLKDNLSFKDYEPFREDARMTAYELAKFVDINPRLISIYP